MLRTSFRHVAVGSVLFCCTTVSAQNFYPQTQQLPPTSGFDYGAQSYAAPQSTYPSTSAGGPVQSPAQGPVQYQLPAPSAYQPSAATHPTSTYGAPYASPGQAPMQSAGAPDAHLMTGTTPTSHAHAGAGGPACEAGCGPQNIAGYGPGGGVPTGGYPYAAYYGNSPKPIPVSGQTTSGPGFFFRYDRLYSSFSAPRGVRDVGNPAEEGSFIVSGIPTEFRNSLDTSFIGDDFEFAGDRFEFGFLDGGGSCDCGRCGSGWMASIISIDQDLTQSVAGGYVLFSDPTGMMLGFASAEDGNGNPIDADINGNNIYGRDGEDLGTLDMMTNMFVPPFDGITDQAAPQDNGDLVSFVPIYSSLSARSYTSISGLSLTRFRDSLVGRSRGCGGRCFKWIYGVRYFNLKDRFTVTGTGSDIYEEMSLDGRAKNFIIGPELGCCVGRSVGPWSFSGQARFTPAVNFIRSRQNADFVAAQNAGPRDVPLNLFSYAVSNSDDDEIYTTVAEWRIDVAYAVTQCLAARVGYTGIFIDEAARSSDMNYRIPDLGLSGDNSDLYIHSLSLGFELFY